MLLIVIIIVFKSFESPVYIVTIKLVNNRVHWPQPLYNYYNYLIFFSVQIIFLVYKILNYYSYGLLIIISENKNL